MDGRGDKMEKISQKRGKKKKRRKNTDVKTMTGTADFPRTDGH